jgi:TolA-binding protein
MKNIFNKTNAPYFVAGALATLTLLASGVFAVAPYVGFLAPVAALSVDLPFIVGGAVFSAVAIALSAVVISKNKTIVEKESSIFDVVSVSNEQGQTISELEAKIQAKEQRISEQKTRLAEKNTELFDKQKQLSKEGVDLDYLDLATSENLNDLDVKISSPENQPAEKEETKVNGYVNQAIGLANWLAGQATKAMPYLATSYLPYVFYDYITTPVSASFDDVNITNPFNSNKSIF